MWLFSRSGFLSIVEHRDDPHLLLVRTRLREDIEAFVAALNAATGDVHEINETPLADYRFRTVAERCAVREALAGLVDAIDYPNFKDAIHGNRNRDMAYMSVWSAMHRLQDDAEDSVPSGNQIHAIAPYWSGGLETWVFDDARVGLEQEPFVAGADEYLTHLVRDIPHARKGFRLLFSAGPFPGWQSKLERLREESDGWWYSSNDGMEGWLCPALFRYFDGAPPTLYCKAQRK